jgi:hypothetical protein
MSGWEYRVVPAPRTPIKARGVKGDEARFAFTLEEALNAPASDGWEYVRSERLPCEHRGWFSRRTEERTVLIFRRGRDGVHEAAAETLRHAAEPRLAADRGARRPAGLAELRPAPTLTRGDDPR